jgi:aminoglycoside phosphotransferase (APT) family kinase protein
MSGRGLGTGPLSAVTRLSGGTQNVLVRFTRASGTPGASRTYVLRRPPVHKRDNSDRTMAREAQVLGALAGTDVPHPGLIAACDDVGVLGAAFYLMEPVPGCNPTVEVPAAWGGDPAAGHQLGLAMIDALTSLGRIDPGTPALRGLGRADGWLERQVGRWRSHLATYDAVEEWPGLGFDGVEEVAAWLEANRPEAWTPGLIHGDFHLANVMVDVERPALTAVVDWELATVGDPLVDLGHLLATWPDPARPGAGVSSDLAGLPGPDELIARYASSSTRPLDAVRWYRVLACFRLGIILEGTRVRACAGLAPRDVGDRLHGLARDLLDQAAALVGG